MQLRPYQSEALEASLRRLRQGVTRQLIALPTGMGKTVIFASLPMHHGMSRRTLVLVHRKELATQALDKFRKWNPKIAGIEMGPRRVGPEVQIIIASVQSLINRLGDRRFLSHVFDTIICDEAHHSASSSYQRVFEHFGLLESDNEKLLLGVTATPFRTDEKRLGKTYDELVYGMELTTAIAQGWLTDMRGFTVRTGTNLDNVHAGGEDFVESELGRAVNNSARNESVVRSWMKFGGGRQTVVFTVDVQHARDLAATFSYYGVPADAVWGGDPQRDEKVARHKRGALKCLCNCNVLTEGYDDWRIGCIVMARPTKSRLLFVQMAGRGLRLPEGISNLLTAARDGIPVPKDDCLLVDIVDNTSLHHLATLTTVLDLGKRAGPDGESVKERIARRTIPRAAGHADPVLLKRAEKNQILIREVDLFHGRLSELPWRRQWDSSYKVELDPDGELKVYQDHGRRWWAEGSIRGGIRFKLKCSTPEEAKNLAHTEARRRLVRRGPQDRVPRAPECV